MPGVDTFVKRNPAAPRDFFACEAAGLQWLSDVDDGVPGVRVVSHDATTLTLQRLVPPTGVVLIDPAAHGGHRETDLAMLALFGCPFYDAVLEGYQDRHPLRPGWRERIGLHQLYPLLAHVVLFGSGYVESTSLAMSSALAIGL